MIDKLIRLVRSRGRQDEHLKIFLIQMSSSMIQNGNYGSINGIVADGTAKDTLLNYPFYIPGNASHEVLCIEMRFNRNGITGPFAYQSFV